MIKFFSFRGKYDSLFDSVIFNLSAFSISAITNRYVHTYVCTSKNSRHGFCAAKPLSIRFMRSINHNRRRALNLADISEEHEEEPRE